MFVEVGRKSIDVKGFISNKKARNNLIATYSALERTLECCIREGGECLTMLWKYLILGMSGRKF